MFLQIHFIFLVEILFTNNICVLCVGKNLSFTDNFSFIVLLIIAGQVRQMTLLSTFINQEQTAALMILFSNNAFKIVSDFLVNHQQTPYILIHFSNNLFSLFVWTWGLKIFCRVESLTVWWKLWFPQNNVFKWIK